MRLRFICNWIETLSLTLFSPTRPLWRERELVGYYLVNQLSSQDCAIAKKFDDRTETIIGHVFDCL